MENVLKVLSYHGQIDAQISTNSCQIGPNDPQEHKEKLQAPSVLLQFYRKEMITWHEMRQFQQPHHYTVWQWRFYPIVQTCKSGSWPLAAEAQTFRGGGGGTGVVFARAPGLRKYKVARTTPKKADERGGGGGGGPNHFFPRTISGHHLHYWVGVPSVHNTDLRGDKQKTQK